MLVEALDQGGRVRAADQSSGSRPVAPLLAADGGELLPAELAGALGVRAGQVARAGPRPP
jgi:hypothetical protein